jgi:hypothetical protein
MMVCARWTIVERFRSWMAEQLQKDPLDVQQQAVALLFDRSIH